MKSRERALRSKRFEVEEKRRKVSDIERMIREFESMVSELDRQVQAEEDRTGVRDKGHFAYSMLAKAATLRREKLRASIADLHVKLETAVRERDAACADLDNTTLPEPRDQERLGRHERMRPAYVR
jgi:flagellar FliJ protein